MSSSQSILSFKYNTASICIIIIKIYIYDYLCIYSHLSGQIIATSHDLTPKGGLVREIPLFQGNLGW